MKSIPFLAYPRRLAIAARRRFAQGACKAVSRFGARRARVNCLPLTMADGFNFMPYRQMRSNRQRRRLFIECGGGALTGALLGGWLIAGQVAQARRLTTQRLALENEIAALTMRPSRTSTDGADMMPPDIGADQLDVAAPAEFSRRFDEVLAILSRVAVPGVALVRVIVAEGSAKIEGIALQFTDIARWQRMLSNRGEVRRVTIVQSRRRIQAPHGGPPMPLPGDPGVVGPSMPGPLPTRIAFAAELLFNGPSQVSPPTDLIEPSSISAASATTESFGASAANRKSSDSVTPSKR